MSAEALEERRFRFLDLPVELRLRIYQYVLTAPDNTIRRYFSFQTNRVKSNLGLSLLRTCKQIYQEAHDVLLSENSILLRTYQDFSAVTRLPKHVLLGLRHLCIIVDCSLFSVESYLFVYDFSVFQSMTRLQSLRICVTDLPITRRRDYYTPMLSRFVESVPADCEIMLGTVSSAQRVFLRDTLRMHWPDERDLVEVEGSALEEAMREVKAAKGAKSGVGTLLPDEARFCAMSQLDDGPRTW